MDFSLSADQRQIQDAIGKICDRIDDVYWLTRDREGGFPHEFYDALAQEGWLGICTAEAQGGAGLGISEASVMMRAVAESGAGLSGASANLAKCLAGEAGFNACQTALMTHGGFRYAKKYHVECYLRESLIPRIAPVSPQLALCFIAEKVLNLPKSY